MRPSILATLACGLLALPLLAGAKPTKASQARHQAMLGFQHDLVSVLALRDSAEPLLGAALLAQDLPKAPDYSNFHALITRAEKTADAGPGVTWARLTDCDAKAQACPNAQALAKLKQQAPDNAAVWLVALGHALAGDHEKDALAALDKAAAADDFDDYAGAQLKALTNASAALPPPKPLYGKKSGATSVAGVRALLVFGHTLFKPMAGYQGAAHLCRADGKHIAKRKATCLKLARTLVWGSSPLARSLGLHLEQTLGDEAARDKARAAKRDLIWQVKSFGELTLGAQSHPKLASDLLRRASSGGTRMSLILAALRDAKVPETAPSGFKPAGD